MLRTHSPIAIKQPHLIVARSARKRFRVFALACTSSFMSMTTPAAASAAPSVEFDIAPIAECRDVTPRERVAQYPNQRLIEVTVPVSVRFHDATMDDVDELVIEVSGATSGLRVNGFAPATQLASDISHEIETTTTTKKSRSFDGTLGGSLPIPGADAAAHLTPSITADLSNCDTATEKVNRLPPKHAVVVSGTSAAGRGVFFKLMRYSQTSLEGIHELTVTFVAPRTWKWTSIQVNCAARGERKMLWMKQTAIIGEAHRMVQLVEMGAKPQRQTVLKPAEATQPAAKMESAADKDKAVAAATKAAATQAATQWRPTRGKLVSAEVSERPTDEANSVDKKRTTAAADAKSDVPASK